jgi:hypothetical protein
MAIRRFSTASISTGNSKSTKLWDQETFQSGMFALATVSLTSTQTSIAFDSIPQNYTHLQVRGLHKQSTSGAWAIIQLNSDTTASNYTYHRLSGDGSTAFAEANASINRTFTSYPHWGSVVIDVLDYANTSKNTTVRTLSGWDGNGSGEINFVSNLWKNTAAVTTLTITLSSFVQYSHFALYGIRTA